MLYHFINGWVIVGGFWAAAPKGTKSCRTQRTLVCPSVQSSVCSSPPGPFRPEICPLRSLICPLRPEICPFRTETCPLRPKSVLQGLKSALLDSRPEIADFRPERADFLPERADFRPERAWGGGTNEQTNRWTDRRTNKSPVFYRTLSLSEPLLCLSFRNTTMQSRAKGIADHILPLELDDLFKLNCERIFKGWMMVGCFSDGVHWSITFSMVGQWLAVFQIEYRAYLQGLDDGWLFFKKGFNALLLNQ